jgi:hypothetical protein
VHLRHVLAGQRAARLAREVEAQAGQFGVDRALAPVLGGKVGELLGVAALGDPVGAQCRQALADVDAGGNGSV